ncbi:MAG: DUF177 domain-containing protein [Parvularculaceae bacterium]
MKKDEAPPAPELSHEVAIADIGRNGRDVHLEANAETRARIALRLRTPSVERLQGDLHAEATRDEVIVTGRIAADLIRECVASLEPMPEHVEEDFEIRFLREAPETASDEDDWMAPEVLESDRIDLGEILVQQLALAMDPFPRKPGAASLAEQYGGSGNVSPFAGLSEALKSGGQKKSDDNQ